MFLAFYKSSLTLINNPICNIAKSDSQKLTNYFEAEIDQTNWPEMFDRVSILDF